jgi:Cdc6-like AAA superfamily ATPase
MTSESDPSDLPLPQRVVLLSLTHCVRTGDEPVHTGDIIQTCRNQMDALRDEALGSLGEAEVSRALNQLEAEGYVELEARNTSPTGKGRPVYSLAVDAETVIESFQPDNQLQSMLEAYQDAWA